MGYTHYWSLKDSTLSQKNFNKVLKDIQKIENYIKENKIRNDFYTDDKVNLFSGNGEGKGIYYDGGMLGGKFECTAFYMNGDASKGLDYETFSFTVGENEWNFCKTARKPYDIAVCMILLSLKYHVRSTKVTSDGDGEQDEWGQAFDLWKVIFGRSVDFKFKEWESGNNKLDGSLSIISSTGNYKK